MFEYRKIISRASSKEISGNQHQHRAIEWYWL